MRLTGMKRRSVLQRPCGRKDRTAMKNRIPTLTLGDLKPDAVIVISDVRAQADFSGLSTTDMWVVGEQSGTVLFRDHPDQILPSTDGRSCTVRRAWKDTDVDQLGRLYVWVEVNWTDGGTPQHFPTSPLRIDIRRAPGTP